MFDPATLAQFLLGTWNCSFHAGNQSLAYTATYSRGFAKPWLLQKDSWRGGGGDQGYYAMDSQTRRWTAVFMEEHGQTTVLVANPVNADRIDYRSAYPDSTAAETFARLSPSRYSLKFTQTAGGKTVNSTDVCTRAGR